MKTENHIQSVSTVVPVRRFATRAAVASLVLAAAIPAAVGATAASKENREAIRLFHINIPKSEISKLTKSNNNNQQQEKTI